MAGIYAEDGSLNVTISGGLNVDIGDITGLQTALDSKIDDSQASAYGLTLIDDANAAAAQTTLGLGSLATKSTVLTADMTDANVTNAKLANMAAATVKGRASGAGTGVPTDLTAAQLLTILGFDVAWTQTTPTAVATGGTLGTHATILRIKKIGRLVFINAQLTITTNGTGSGALYIPIPDTPSVVTPIAGFQSILAPFANLRTSVATDGRLYFQKLDGTYAGVDTVQLNAAGVYESAS